MAVSFKEFKDRAFWNMMISVCSQAISRVATPADKIPGDFFKSLEIPGVSRFLLYKHPSKNKLPFLFKSFGSFPWSNKTQPLDTSHFIQVKVSHPILFTIPLAQYFNISICYRYHYLIPSSVHSGRLSSPGQRRAGGGRLLWIPGVSRPFREGWQP